MWWGGEEENPVSGDSSSTDTTPPVDIMDFPPDVSGAASVVSETSTDLFDLKEQFAMQENLLGQLKNVLKSNEEKLKVKEKEDYAVQLSRSKRSKFGRSADSVMTSSPVIIPSGVPSGGGGKISQLKRQLDEERAKENEEMQSRRGLEDMVKQLQRDLQERDTMISQMHEQMSVASVTSFQTSPISSPFVMSPGTTSPGDRSPDRTPPLGCSVDSAASGFWGHYRPMTDSDNKVIELTEKNIELERKLLDMDENLRAKDELIRARTAAVTLMSADLSAKGKSTLDQLEDTRTEMRQMQTNFSETEAHWREKNGCLQVELQNTEQKLESLEESFGRMEKVRFELSTKNAELQEKVVHLQTSLSEVKAAKEEESIANFHFEEKMKGKIDALERTIEASEMTRNNRKQDFIESIKDIVSDDDLAEKIIDLENKLTEVEEEKGNLQLRLVDFEEVSNNQTLAKDELKETQERLRQAERDLECVKEAFEAVEADKTDLAAANEDLKSQLGEMSLKVEDMLNSNANMSMSKVKLEMKSVELEELTERLESERQELIANITDTRKHSEETVKTLIEVQKAHAALNTKMRGLEEENKKCQNSQRLHDEDMLEKAELIKEQKIALSQLEKVLHDKTTEMSDLLVQVDQFKKELAEKTEEIQNLNGTISDRDEKILELSSLLDENEVRDKITQLQNQLEQSQSEAKVKIEENLSLTDQLASLQDQCQSLQNDLAEKADKETEFQDKIQNLNGKLAEQENALEDFRTEIEAKDSKFQEFEQKRSELETKTLELNQVLETKSGKIEDLNENVAILEGKLKEMTEETSTKAKEIEEAKGELSEMIDINKKQEQLILDLTDQIDEASVGNQNSQVDIQGHKTKIQDLETKLDSKSQNIDQLEQNIRDKTNTIEDLKHQKTELEAKIHDLESRITESKLYQKIGSDTTNDTIDQLEQNLQNKADMIEDLQHQKSDLEKSIDDLKNRIEALQEANNEELEAVQAANEALKVRIEELETSTEQEDNSQKVQQLNDKMVALRNKAKEYLKKSKELQSKNEDLEKQLEEAKQSDEKDDLAEEQISLLQEMLKQKTLELSSVNYAMDSLKVVHHEEMTTQVEICSSLNEQLSKLSEDLSENLQEKADLEGQMENIKTQVQDQLEGQTKTIENLSKELSEAHKSNEEVKTQLEKALIKAKSVQQNYDSLVANHGESKDLIMERDKAKAKCDLLTDKCKKLLVKCKQQEDSLKKNKELQINLDRVQESLDKVNDEKSTLESLLDDIKDLNEAKQLEMETLKNELEQAKIDHVQALQVQVEDSATRESQLRQELGQHTEQLSKDHLEAEVKLQEKVEEIQRLEKAHSEEREALINERSKEIEKAQEDLAQAEQESDEFKAKILTLESDLAGIREEMRDLTISKNKLIEEAHEKIQNMQMDNSEHEEQKSRIIELISQLEQSREQKCADDLNLASVKETVDNLHSQLNEKESEIVKLDQVIKQKEHNLNNAEQVIQQVKEESESCQAAKLQLQDQLDSLTIVAENLQTLQHQVHLKDNEIEQLRNELEQVRQELEDQARNNQDNQVRPPPDITQQPSVQPDIASSVQSVQPDLMPPSASQQVSPFDLVQNNDGWDNDWADDNAANWFDNDNNQASAQPAAAMESAPQLLQQKEEECQALKQQIDTLISARAELEDKVKEMKETNEKLLDKVSTLEHIPQQTVQCQTEEEVPEASKAVPQVEPEVPKEELQSPPPNVFAWDAFAQPSPFDSSTDFFATASSSTNPQDFFSQPPSEIPASRTQDIFATAEVPKENSDVLREEIKTLQDNTIDLERQIQLMKETELNMKQQIGDLETLRTNLELDLQGSQAQLQYEKSLLEEQINQLPSMDAFNSLQNVNENLNSELQKLKKKLDEWPSSEEFDNLKKANEDLKLKLASIGESQNEQYEVQLQELYGQIESLETQLKAFQAQDEDQVLANDKPVSSSLFVNTVEEQPSSFTGFFEDNALSLQPASSFFDSAPVQAVQFGQDLNLQQELEELKQKLADLQSVNSELEIKLNNSQASQSEIEQLKTALDEQKSIIEQWNTWAADKTAEINQLMADKEELQRANTVQDMELQESKSKIEELTEAAKQTVYDTNEDKAKEWQDKIDHLESESSEVIALKVKEITDLKNQVTILENQVTQLQSQLEDKPHLQIPQIVQEIQEQETKSFFDDAPQEPTNLLAVEPIVEKGLSASSYFDQLGEPTAQDDLKVEEANTSVFEAIQKTSTPMNEQSGGSSETIEWYKTQLEQYQQAINDWQVWSENQMKDVATMQESLAYYTEALAEEQSKVKVDNNPQVNEELNGLRASVRAKEIEVEDLTETLDRLRTEKSDLEQEVTELTMQNQDLKREKEESNADPDYQFDVSLYEETKQSLDETLDKLSQVKDELSGKNVEIAEMTKLKESQEFQLSALQNELTTLKQVLEQSRETVEEKDRVLEELKRDLENAKEDTNANAEIEVLKVDLDEQKSVIEQWNTWAADKTQEINQLKSDKEELQKSLEVIEAELEESKTQLKKVNDEVKTEEPLDNKLKEEVEQQRKVLEDWNAWALQKTEEYNQLLEAYNQYVVSYQTLETEIERLKGANADLEAKVTEGDDDQKNPADASKDNNTLAYQEEIERLKNEITGLAQKMTIPNQAFVETQAQLDNKALESEIERLKAENVELTEKISGSSNFDDSPAWGAPEDEVLLTSSDNNATALLELEAEISELKQKIRGEQEEKVKLNEDINAAKVKHGKLTLKVKQLTKELNSRKSASPAASSSTADDSLDKAIQDELNQRAAKAEKALKDSQQQIQDLTVEKSRLLERVDTLEGGNEKFMELKENQDREVEFLKNQNLQLQNQLGGFEWQLQEKDEIIANLEEDLATHAALDTNEGTEEDINQKLKQELIILKRALSEMEANCLLFKKQIEDLQQVLEQTNNEKEDIANQFLESQEQLDILIEENEVLRNIQAQYESMKMQSEFQSSEKKKSSTNNQPMEDYENFQALNVSMQDEINQLRAYISQNVSSTSTEVQGFFKDQDQDLALQNQRLQLDLDKTIGERRLLSRQMENWKRQLTEAASQGEDPETYQDDDEYETEEVLKLKQEQAYRSVGALQLRVEELTLEVTKLLEERDTLQLRLSNVMRQYERHKESASRASTACSTPIPWSEPPSEVSDLKRKIEELSKLNYSMDVELQKEREIRELMQTKLRLYGTPRRTSGHSSGTGQDRSDSPGPVLHI